MKMDKYNYQLIEFKQLLDIIEANQITADILEDAENIYSRTCLGVNK
jgi:hypothetical protein